MHRACRQAMGLVLIIALTAGNSAVGQDSPSTDDESAKIKAAIQSCVAAFHERNVEKLVAHWSPGGVYSSRTNGGQIVGREAIAEEFKLAFEGENLPKLAVATESVEFISPSVALERGTATVVRGDDEPIESNYTAVYVKRNDKWLIDRVTEDEVSVEYSNRDQLKELEWLIGDWTDEFDGGTIEVGCKWTRNENFISRTYRVWNEDEIASSGLQIIGWDPSKKQIRSWLFDSNGGFISGTWQKRDTKWIVQSVATLAEGGTGSFTSIFHPLEDGTYAWEKINRVLDGELLPNIPESVVRRK
jgi:uncharacterized protein (TIGR02246 family)